MDPELMHESAMDHYVDYCSQGNWAAAAAVARLMFRFMSDGEEPWQEIEAGKWLHRNSEAGMKVIAEQKAAA
jgi:hypothetical protein